MCTLDVDAHSTLITPALTQAVPRQTEHQRIELLARERCVARRCPPPGQMKRP